MGDYLLTIDPVKMLENKLEQMLQPVTPNPVFIDRLQRRLTTSTPTVLEERPRVKAYYIIVLGLLCGVFLLWMIRQILPNKD